MDSKNSIRPVTPANIGSEACPGFDPGSGAGAGSSSLILNSGFCRMTKPKRAFHDFIIKMVEGLISEFINKGRSYDGPVDPLF